MNSPSYNREGLASLTVSQLRGLARENGITLSATRKAGIIDEIMEAQDA